MHDYSKGLRPMGLVAATLLMTTSLAGCGGSEADSKTGSSSLEGKIVARVAPAVQQVESEGQGFFRAALDTEGVELQVANADGDPTKQRQLTEQYIAQGVDALLQTNIDLTGWEDTFKEATDKGIAVINMSGAPISNSTINFNQDQSSPGFEVGEFVGNWLKEKKGCKGEVGFMTTVTIPAFQPRTKNAETRIHEICPDVTFVEPVDAYTPEMGAEAGGNLIQTHPEMDAIVAVNDDAALGAYQAIQEAGKTDPDDFMLTGYDATPEGLKLLKQGDSVFQLSWGYAIPYWVTQGAWYAMDAIAGKEIPTTGRLVGLPVTSEDVEDYESWVSEPLAPENEGRYADLIDESDVVLESGDSIDKAFE